MSLWGWITDQINTSYFANKAGQAGAAAGTYAGTQGDIQTKYDAAAKQIGLPPPVKPSQAIAETAKGAIGAQGPEGFLHEYWVWAVIVIVGIIGLWGLVAPGGGVAIIERKITKG
jgi:hypothetical protein